MTKMAIAPSRRKAMAESLDRLEGKIRRIAERIEDTASDIDWSTDGQDTVTVWLGNACMDLQEAVARLYPEGQPKCYQTVTCDKAGCSYEEQYPYTENDAKTIERMECDGWVIDGDMHICPDCVDKNTDYWNGITERDDGGADGS